MPLLFLCQRNRLCISKMHSYIRFWQKEKKIFYHKMKCYNRRTQPHYKHEHRRVFWANERNLNKVCYQTPMVHAEIAPCHSFGLFQRQYPLLVSSMLPLFWLMQHHPVKRITDIVNLERGLHWWLPAVELISHKQWGKVLQSVHPSQLLG